MWSEAARGPLPMGAASFELPALVLDRACMGVWRIFVLACAPLAAVAASLEKPGGLDALGRLAFGDGLEQSEAIDVESIEQALRDGSGRRLPGMPMGAHMGFMSLARNDANFMQARCGEAVALDRMRGSSAMLCARFKAKTGRPRDVDAALGRLFDALASAWGPTSFCLGGGGRIGDRSVEHPTLSAPWPSAPLAWTGSELAREQAAELEKSSRAGKGPSTGASRI